MIRFRRISPLLCALGLIAIVGGCVDAVPLDTRSEQQKETDPFLDHSKRPSILGEGGLNFFGGDNNNSGGALGVRLISFKGGSDVFYEVG